MKAFITFIEFVKCLNSLNQQLKACVYIPYKIFGSRNMQRSAIPAVADLLYSTAVTAVIDSCRHCGHKSLHRSVAVRHIWRAHRTSASLPVHDLPSDDISLYVAPCSDSRLPPITYTSMNVAKPCLTQTEVSAVNHDVEAKCPRSIGDAALSTTSSSDVDEDRPYPVCLVPASASRTSPGSSQIRGTDDIDLPGPPMNPVLSEQQSMRFQPWSSNWNRPWTSAGFYRAERNCSPSDLLHRSTPSTSSSSFSGWSLPSFPLEGLKLEGSAMENVAGHSGSSESTDSALFQKQDEGTHVKSHLGLTASAAERFACSLCSLSYKRVADLNRHMKQKHWTSLAAYSLSTSCVNAASLTAARDRPLNLAAKNANSSQPARRKLPDHTRQKDASQERPLDLSITSKTLTADKSSSGRSSECLDGVDDWRCSSGQIRPPFIVDDFMPKSTNVSLQNATHGHHGSAVSPSASTVSSFYASFAKFMENAYRPVWKSYLDGMFRRNARGARCQNHCAGDDRSVFNEDLKQMNVNRCSMNNKLSRPLTTRDDNNNTLNCDFSGRNVASLRCADVSQPSVLTASATGLAGDEDIGSKHGGSWGQCPLCPFVCPHPLVMRSHLDVHEEWELQQACTQSGQGAVKVATAAADSHKTSFELGDAGRQSSVDVTCGPNSSYQEDAGRSSTSTTMSNCLTWSSTFAAASDASSATVPTSSTPGWLSARLFPVPDLTTDVAGKSAGWNSASGLMTKSAGLAMVPGQSVVSFPSSLDGNVHRKVRPPGKAEDARDRQQLYDQQLYDGSQCSERCRYKKDMKKHVDRMCRAGGHVVTATASAVDTTMSWTTKSHISTPPTGQWRVPMPPTSTGVAGWWNGWTPNGHLVGTFPCWHSAALNSQSASTVNTSTIYTPLSSHMRAADFKVSFIRYYSPVVLSN